LEDIQGLCFILLMILITSFIRSIFLIIYEKQVNKKGRINPIFEKNAS